MKQDSGIKKKKRKRYKKKYILKAMDYYEKAIRLAKENEFLSEEGLSYELAGKFYQEIGKKELASYHMGRAYDCYQRWGAAAKLKHLEETYSDLLDTVKTQVRIEDTITTMAKTLDLSSVIKASQVILYEIDQTQLIKNMMKIVIENAGAKRGVLLLIEDGQLSVSAEASAEDVAILEPRNLEGSDLPLSIIRYVLGVKKSILLSHASKEGDFVSDQFVQGKDLKSVLCMPLFYQDKMTGILYLENNLIENAFTKERLALLELLISQIGISLENTRMYEELKEYSQKLEEKVKERTRDLREEIEKHEKTEESLKKSEQRFRDVVENAMEWIWEIDKDGKYTYASSVVEEVLGYRPEELVGKKYFYDFFHPEEREGLKEAALESIRKKEPFRNFVNKNIHKNEKIIWLSTSGVPVLDDQGNLSGYRGADTDVTALKEAEQELSKEKVLLEKQSVELTRLNASKDKFFSILAHDLRAPFLAIKKVIEFPTLVRMEKDPEVVKEMEQDIQNMVKNAHDLLENLLRWGQVQTGWISYQYDKIDLVKLFQENVDIFQEEIKDKGIKTRIELKEKIFIQTDKNLLSTVVRNLMSNAVKFTDKGEEIILSASKDKQDIKKGKESKLKESLEITIRDTGIGIKEEDLKNLLKLKTNRSTVGTKGETGTGIGLFICRDIVEKLGGKMILESKVGQGTIVRVNLPGS